MNNIDEKLLSIIIPTYNRIYMLDRLLLSITRLQYRYIQIIVVDDCSEQDVFSVIEKYSLLLNIRYIRNTQNLFVERSRSVGFFASTGKYVVFCDDDDFYIESNFFDIAIKKMEHDEYLSFVSANAFIFYCISKKIERKIMNILGRQSGINYLRNFQIKYNKPLSTFTTVFRRSSLEDISVYFNDSSLYLYALLSGDAYILHDMIGVYCIHSKNLTKDCKIDFIIDVLNSKYHIYQMIKYKVKWNTLTWWTNQLIVTSSMYLTINTKRTDIIQYVHYIYDNYEVNKFIFMKFIFKYLLKKVFTNCKNKIYLLIRY